MAKAPRFKLTLSKLDFASIVSGPAQETAKLLLIKRAATGDEFTATAKFVKANDELGLAWFWAFQGTTSDGTAYHDLQGDNVVDDDTMIKACAEFMASGANVDENHDGISGAGKIIFGMPMNAEVAKTYGLGDVKASGFMLVIKPAPAVLAKLKSGELDGISIAGRGERAQIDKLAPAGMCADCGDPMGVDDKTCDACGGKQATKRVAKAVWSTADVDDLPDSSFLYVESGGKKSDGKTTPRSLRHFPYKTAAGAIDIDHLRDAIGRIPQSSLPATLRNELQVKAEKLLAEQHDKSDSSTKNAAGAATPLAKSPPPAPLPHGSDMKLVVLTESQHAHYSKLAGDDAEAFLAKSTSERDTIVKAAIDADPVVYKTASGLEIRKSAGDIAVQLAKQADDQAKTIATQTAEIAKANDARQVEIYKARAKVEIAHIAGTDEAKVDLLKAIDAFTTDQPRRDAMITLHKSADAFAKDAGNARGSSDVGPAGGTATAALKAAVEEIAKRDGTPYEIAFVKATASDPKVRELYAAAQTERN